MTRFNMLQIKAQCIFHASEYGMTILEIDDVSFRAAGNGSEIYISYEFLFQMVQQGWQISETLQNETGHHEESA